MNRIENTTLALLAFLAVLVPGHVAAVDWADVQGTQVLMFQPGQSAWEWLVVPSRHDGARRMREGRDCLYCHEGEETVIGNAIAAGERLEPDPMTGMPALVELEVKVVSRDGDLHVRLSWPALAAGRSAGQSDVAARATMMFGNEAIPTTALAGCWMSCHVDLPGMQSTASGEPMMKYLPNSRARMAATGGGRELRDAADLEAELTAGRILEYMQAELDGEGLVRVFDGYVLDARHEHETPAVSGTARRENGRWVVEFTRPLAPVGPHLALQAGPVYTVNFALHTNHAEGRHHYVAFPMSMRIGAAEAMIVVPQRP